MFAYCNNAPVVFEDSSGHAPCSITVSIYDGSSGEGIIDHPQNSPFIRDVTDEVLAALECATHEAVLFCTVTKKLFGNNALTTAAIYAEFYNQVNHNAPWDIKRPQSWETTIGTPYPGFDAKLKFGELTMTPESLGNFTYGVLGYYYGIPLAALIGGSYYAADFPTEGAALTNEFKDWIYIILGYEYAREAQGK